MRLLEEEKEYIEIYVEDGDIYFECQPLARRDNFECKETIKTIKKEGVKYSYYQRSAKIVAEAKDRDQGKCKLCGNIALFKKKNGEPFLEVHHIVWLSQDGKDELDNVVCLCPNCHRKMHELNKKEDIEFLIKSIK